MKRKSRSLYRLSMPSSGTTSYFNNKCLSSQGTGLTVYDDLHTNPGTSIGIFLVLLASVFSGIRWGSDRHASYGQE